ncbi:MAG: hypothetical protein JNL70_25450 [Saprospiraceae bacterium]|nr:hypothetical protein [Saprospiraceae bacterium]
MNKKRIELIFLSFLSSLFLFSAMGCKEKVEAKIHFRVKFDGLQERLNSKGFPTGVGSGNAAQTPLMNQIGVQKLELTTNNTTEQGKGLILFSTPETSAGGENAIDFSQVKMAKEGEIFLSVPIKFVSIGRYEFTRVSVAYQNLDVLFNMYNVPFAGNFIDQRGTLASFLGYNNYITPYKVWNKLDNITGNRKQGYWCYETKMVSAYASNDKMFSGFSPEGSTTVVNMMSSTIPNALGSGIITGKFDTPLSITGTETEDIYITLSFSVNRSFEWEESIERNGKWDYNVQPNTGQPVVEKVIDVGLRGLKITYDVK